MTSYSNITIAIIAVTFKNHVNITSIEWKPECIIYNVANPNFTYVHFNRASRHTVKMVKFSSKSNGFILLGWYIMMVVVRGQSVRSGFTVLKEYYFHCISLSAYDLVLHGTR